MEIGALLGFAVGCPLGFVLQRSQFCMHSALREALARRPGSSLRAYLLALGVQMAGVAVLSRLRFLEVQAPPIEAGAAALGGAIFGLGMILAKG